MAKAKESAAATVRKWTASDVCDALDRKYKQHIPGPQGEGWMALREARAGAGFAGNNGRCDFLAINTWHGRGLQVIGHEVKVSRADWNAELASPEKAEVFGRYCRRWWVVMPAKLASEVRHEVPPTWGLLAVADNGVCREVIAAPVREPEPIPEWWWIGWLAQIDRRQRRDVDRAVAAAVDAAVKAERESVARQAEDRASYKVADHERLLRQVSDFAKATGVDVRNGRGGYNGEFERMAKLWKMVCSQSDIGPVVDRMVDAVTELAAAVSPFASKGRCVVSGLPVAASEITCE